MFDDSDYVVEEYIKPSKVRKRIINDERADIFGNFEDEKDKLSSKKGVKKTKVTPVLSEENPFEDDSDGNEDDNGMDEDDVVQDDTVSDENEGEQENETGEENESDEVDNESDEEASDSDDPAGSDGEESSNDIDDEGTDEVTPAEKPSKNSKQAPAQNNGNSQKSKSATQNEKPKSKAAKAEKPKSNGAQKTSKLELTDDQLKALIRGSSKQDRFVLYVTNLNYSTTRDTLTEFFSAAGPVKSVRIPKVRRGAFAFIEMSDVNGFKNALALHNRTIENYTIKVQISEGGKKKSSNKKNILKQKNRKLAEMRHETKQFQRSGKGYDKTIKKEINQRKMQQNRRIAKKQAKKSTQ